MQNKTEEAKQIDICETIYSIVCSLQYMVQKRYQFRVILFLITVNNL